MPLKNLVTIGSPQLFTITIEPDADAGGMVQFKYTRISGFKNILLQCIVIIKVIVIIKSVIALLVSK